MMYLLFVCITVFLSIPLKAEPIIRVFEPAIEIKPPSNSAKSKTIDVDQDGVLDFHFMVNNIPEYESVTFTGLLRQNHMIGDGDTNNIRNFFPLCLDEDVTLWADTEGLWYNGWDYKWQHAEYVTVAGYGFDGQGHWTDLTESKYIGFRFWKNNNFYYGWFEIFIPDVPNQCIIKRVAYEPQPNTAIKTGLNDLSVHVTQTSGFKVFPSITSDYIDIEFPVKQLAQYQMRIVNVIGENIMHIDKQNENIQNLYVGNLPKGKYYVVVRFKDYYFTKPFYVMY